MPDLTPIPFAHCQTAESWSLEVEGSRGKTYTVTWDRHSHRNRWDVQYDYSCTCESYRYKGGAYCKHILKAKGSHCNWQQFMDGGQPVDGKCPNCTQSVAYQMQGV